MEFKLSETQWDKMIEILDFSPDCVLHDKEWLGGICRFEYLSPELLLELVNEGFADPEERQNDSPSIEEWLTFIHDNITLRNKVSFHGYIVHKNRDDRRISIEGIQSSHILESVMNEVKFTEKEIDELEMFCHYADEVQINEDDIWVWYD